MILRRHHRGGFFTVELLTSLMLVIAILAAFAYSLIQFSHLSDILMTRQRAALAAEAVLNEIRGGHEPSKTELAARFTDLTFEVHRRPGLGDWESLTLVTVEVRGTADGGVPIRVLLEGYVREVSP